MDELELVDVDDVSDELDDVLSALDFVPVVVNDDDDDDVS